MGSALISHLLKGSVEGECCWEQCCLRTASVVVQWVSALVSHKLRGSVGVGLLLGAVCNLLGARVVN